jgi:hypothetical protein
LLEDKLKHDIYRLTAHYRQAGNHESALPQDDVASPISQPLELVRLRERYCLTKAPSAYVFILQFISKKSVAVCKAIALLNSAF